MPILRLCTSTVFVAAATWHALLTHLWGHCWWDAGATDRWQLHSDARAAHAVPAYCTTAPAAEGHQLQLPATRKLPLVLPGQQQWVSDSRSDCKGSIGGIINIISLMSTYICIQALLGAPHSITLDPNGLSQVTQCTHMLPCWCYHVHAAITLMCVPWWLCLATELSHKLHLDVPPA